MPAAGLAAAERGAWAAEQTSRYPGAATTGIPVAWHQVRLSAERLRTSGATRRRRHCGLTQMSHLDRVQGCPVVLAQRGLDIKSVKTVAHTAERITRHEVNIIGESVPV